MKRKLVVSSLLSTLILVSAGAMHAAGWPYFIADWPQWGRSYLHTSSIDVVGQKLHRQLANIVYDPFVAQEKAESLGELIVHYQVPLVDNDLVFMESKSGKYISCDPPGSGQPFPCGPDAWNSQDWNERAFAWFGGHLKQIWNFQTDWKPEPNSDMANGDGLGLFGWEPVFHAALRNGFVYVPGAGGTVYQVDEFTGRMVRHDNPFSGKLNSNRYVSGPLTIGPEGNVYYNVVQLDPTNPWGTDIAGAWLVKIEPGGKTHVVSYSTIAPPSCAGCGSQRAGINVSPAVSADGKTIYTASTAHFFALDVYLLAVNSDLTPKWNASLTVNNGQIQGAIFDLSSATPVVLPDGSILYGVLTPDSDQGYMLKFDSTGQFLADYNFGWDDTPAVYSHDGTYSVITKDNRYDSGGPYYMTQLNSDLEVEWQYKSSDNFEWCVNAPAVDRDGNVYADSEDGYLYAIRQGGTLKDRIFLQSAIGAAYTPVSLGRDGKVYTENDGNMFVSGR